ncbi:MAG TPA: ROK family protein [Acidobacteriaceae bacterium]
MSDQVLVGVDIGGTKTAVVLSFRPPVVIHRIVFPTLPAEGPSPILVRIVEAIRESLSLQDLSVADLKSIGVSCGSPLDPINGVIQEPPNLPTWKNVPIKALLEREFQVECFLENDANAGALAEHRFGAGRGVRNMVFLTMGTGIGAGLILNGHLYRGTTYSAGEIGHVRLTQSGPLGHNKAGTVEGWASGAGMTRMATVMIESAVERGETTLLTLPKIRNGYLVSAHDIWKAAQAGDCLAQSIVATSGARLGEAMAMMIDILNPECIVVGGLAVRMREALLGPARAVVQREALVTSVNACRIVAAALEEQVGDIAALCVAMEGHYHAA